MSSAKFRRECIMEKNLEKNISSQETYNSSISNVKKNAFSMDYTERCIIPYTSIAPTTAVRDRK